MTAAASRPAALTRAELSAGRLRGDLARRRIALATKSRQRLVGDIEPDQTLAADVCPPSHPVDTGRLRRFTAVLADQRSEQGAAILHLREPRRVGLQRLGVPGEVGTELGS